MPSGSLGTPGGLLTLSWLRHPKAQRRRERGITKLSGAWRDREYRYAPIGASGRLVSLLAKSAWLPLDR